MPLQKVTLRTKIERTEVQRPEGIDSGSSNDQLPIPSGLFYFPYLNISLSDYFTHRSKILFTVCQYSAHKILLRFLRTPLRAKSRNVLLDFLAHKKSKNQAFAWFFIRRCVLGRFLLEQRLLRRLVWLGRRQRAW